MSTLYELASDFNDIFDVMAEENLDSDTLMVLMHDAETNMTAIADKVSNGIGLIRSLENVRDGLDAEIKRLQIRKKSVEGNICNIKEYYLQNLSSIGAKKIVTPRGNMTVAKVGGKQPLTIDDEALVPSDFKIPVTTYKVDKEKIRASIAKGETVPGAHLAERGFYLKIS